MHFEYQDTIVRRARHMLVVPTDEIGVSHAKQALVRHVEEYTTLVLFLVKHTQTAPMCHLSIHHVEVDNLYVL